MTGNTDRRFSHPARILQNIPEESTSRLLAAMEPVQVSAGETFIRQGEQGDCLYLIESGACVVSVDKYGTIHPIAVRGPGEMVGEMALITGESRNANVMAEQGTILWRIDRRLFEEICIEYPVIRLLLTEIMTNRLENAPLMADRTIGQYVVTEIQGRGSTSIVYKGRRAESHLPVAIKMLKHDLAMKQDFLDAFNHESRVLTALYHDSIVKIYDIQYLYRTVFIIMEYLNGDSLGTVLGKDSLLPPEISCRVLIDICFGLFHAHNQGVVHGDIKPSNIFVLEDYRTKIIDFGLATRLGTRETGFYGTPRYASPEQFLGEPVTERSDIYSLGLLAYRIATGKEAFDDRDTSTLLARKLCEEIPDPRLANPAVPDNLRNFIRRASRKDPADRYPSIVQGIKELKS